MDDLSDHSSDFKDEFCLDLTSRTPLIDIRTRDFGYDVVNFSQYIDSNQPFDYISNVEARERIIVEDSELDELELTLWDEQESTSTKRPQKT